MVPVAGDWNGDGVETVGVFRAGTWRLANSRRHPTAAIVRSWGHRGDVPVVGDWDGDGRDDIGIYRRGKWNLALGGHARRFRFGRGRDQPVTGDWNSDGRSTVGVVRRGRWLLRPPNGKGAAQAYVRFGRHVPSPSSGASSRLAGQLFT